MQTHLQHMTDESSVAKGELTHYENFLLVSQCFLTLFHRQIFLLLYRVFNAFALYVFELVYRRIVE